MLTEYQLHQMGNWRTINKILPSLTEVEVKEMLDVEVAGKRRPDVIKRLHARFNMLRSVRERNELLEIPSWLT